MKGAINAKGNWFEREKKIYKEIPYNNAQNGSSKQLLPLPTEYLKPQDSFREFHNFFLDLQKVQEIIRKHHQTFMELLWNLNYIWLCNIAQWQILSLCT